MAEMGCGYGSEFQLMRFLGHHRQELNEMIQKATGESRNIQWEDFPYDDERISGDGEWEGINCFKKLNNYDDIESKWKKFWPQRGKSMNWDGIFRIGDTWFFVEAKANEGECFQECSASSENSKNTIIRAFEKTQEWLGATKNDWIYTKCYQLANRLAFLYFCNQCGIKARMVYIGFVNGYRRKKDEVRSDKRWMEIWEKELDTLGLDLKKIESYISFIHPICENREEKE